MLFIIISLSTVHNVIFKQFRLAEMNWQVQHQHRHLFHCRNHIECIVPNVINVQYCLNLGRLHLLIERSFSWNIYLLLSTRATPMKSLVASVDSSDLLSWNHYLLAGCMFFIAVTYSGFLVRSHLSCCSDGNLVKICLEFCLWSFSNAIGHVSKWLYYWEC